MNQNVFLTDCTLQHKVDIELADGTKQVRSSTIPECGGTEPGGYQGMAKLGEFLRPGMKSTSQTNTS